MIFHSQFSESEVRQSQVTPGSQSRLLLCSQLGSRMPHRSTPPIQILTQRSVSTSHYVPGSCSRLWSSGGLPCSSVRNEHRCLLHAPLRRRYCTMPAPCGADVFAAAFCLSAILLMDANLPSFHFMRFGRLDLRNRPPKLTSTVDEEDKEDAGADTWPKWSRTHGPRPFPSPYFLRAAQPPNALLAFWSRRPFLRHSPARRQCHVYEIQEL